MLPDRSKRAAPANSPLPRLALIRARELLALALILLALLILIFPDSKMFTRLLSRSPSNDLNIAYLENLLRSDRENAELRLLLADIQSAQGDYSAIKELLDPVDRYGDTDQRRQALRIRLDALSAAHRLGRPGIPAERSKELLQILATGPQPILPLRQLATYALKLGHQPLARQLYRRAAIVEQDGTILYRLSKHAPGSVKASCTR